MVSPFHVLGAPGATGLLFAHRGAPQLRAENTLPSFAAALAAGAQALELDVHAAKDGSLWVLHDATLERTTYAEAAKNARYDRGQHPRQGARQPARHAKGIATFIAQLSAEAVAERIAYEPESAAAAEASRIPSLAAVLLAFPQAAFNVDLKGVAPAQIPSVLATVRQVRAALGHRQALLLTSSATEVQAALDVCLHADDQVARGMGRRDVLQVLAAARLGLGPIPRLRGRACQMPRQLRLRRAQPSWWLPLVNARLLRYLHAMDCPLHLWDDGSGSIDDVATVRELFALGVDGVFTDAIHRLLPSLGPATHLPAAKESGKNPPLPATPSIADCESGPQGRARWPVGR